MLAKNNNYFKEASETVYELTQEAQIRQQCLAYEDYNQTMKGIENNFVMVFNLLLFCSSKSLASYHALTLIPLSRHSLIMFFPLLSFYLKAYFDNLIDGQTSAYYYIAITNSTIRGVLLHRLSLS